MKTLSTLLLISLLFFSQTTSAATSAGKKKLMIQQSIANYPGNCPCPYSTMKNGRSCGKTSAWSKPRGKSPLCYASDIK
jgi:hypothetical protein